MVEIDDPDLRSRIHHTVFPPVSEGWIGIDVAVSNVEENRINLSLVFRFSGNKQIRHLTAYRSQVANIAHEDPLAAEIWTQACAYMMVHG